MYLYTHYVQPRLVVVPFYETIQQQSPLEFDQITEREPA